MLRDRRLLGPFTISPDGRHVAVAISDGQFDIWSLDLDSRGLSRVTFGAGSETFPVWSPDGTRLYYSTNTGGVTRTVAKAVDGSDAVTEITTHAFFPMSISNDGRTLAGRAITNNSFDVVTVDLASRKQTAVVATAANESEPSFSPDGRFIAYQSDESGRSEVFVQAFPTGSNTIYAVPIALQPFSAGAAQTLFSAPNLFAFDMTADGKRLVAVTQAEDSENVSLVLVSGWFEELKAKMRPAR